MIARLHYKNSAARQFVFIAYKYVQNLMEGGMRDGIFESDMISEEERKKLLKDLSNILYELENMVER
jgi:hypothetical protein